MANFKEKIFMSACEIRGRMLQIQRHLPILKQFASRTNYGGNKILSVEEGRKKLTAAIEKGSPFMAARFGTTEGRALYDYWKMKNTGGGIEPTAF